MSRRDGTGPMGRGPMTGRGFGLCAGLAVPALMGLAFGRGRGGRRGGRGWRNMFYATGLTGGQRAAMDTPAAAAPTAEAEKQVLEAEVGAIQSQLDAVKKRLAELKAEKA